MARVPDLTSRLAPVGARLLRTRWFVRAPIRLYRLGLGPLLGTRLVQLEHRGRTTGLPRLVVLEVVAIEAGAPVVVSGFGERGAVVSQRRRRPGGPGLVGGHADHARCGSTGSRSLDHAS